MNFRKKEGLMKKSVDDLLSSSQDVFNQAISLTKRSPSPREKSDVLPTSSAENVVSDTRQQTTAVASTAVSASPPPSNSSSIDPSADELKRPNSKLAEKAKKKAWYNVIYPSYKSRSEDFKKLFKLPEEERLLVDYSCAIQKDILVHGRMYVSSNYVHTCYGEQLGLTSDDEDYIDPTNYEEPENLNSADSEAKVSSSSSSKLTNAPTESEKLRKEKSKNSSSSSSSLVNLLKPTEKNLVTSIEAQSSLKQELLPTDMSGSSSDSDSGSNNKMDTFVNNAECTSMHEGRQMVHTILPMKIETVFGLLFHRSKFFNEFHKMRKTENLVQGEWEDQEDGTKKRVQTLTVAITQLVGPKQAHVTETQTMRPCSVPGVLYSIDGISENAGIPYADSFYLLLHYCLKKSVDDSTVLSVHAQIKYKKSVWGVVKGFIEKNTWVGLEDFYDALSQALMLEYNIPPAKAKRRNRKSTASHASQLLPNINIQTPLPSKQAHIDDMQHVNQINVRRLGQIEKDANDDSSSAVGIKQERLSWIVIFLLVTLITFNVVLYYKLGKIEDYDTHAVLSKASPKTTNDWMKLLTLQEKLHVKEMHEWHEVIQSAIELLKKTENSLLDLQNLIFTYRAKSNGNGDLSAGS